MTNIYVKLVKPEYSKAMGYILERANQILEDTFGMSLVELPVRTNAGNEAKASHSNTFILRNNLKMKDLADLVQFPSEDELGFIVIVLALIFVHGGKISLGMSNLCTCHKTNCRKID